MNYRNLIPLLLPTVAVAQNATIAKPNILMIAIDDLNHWPGEFTGMAKTPNIDALANSSTVFSSAHCVVPASNPSRTALFTGLRPETTGQYTNEGMFRDKRDNISLTTLPQYLQACGYETVSAGKVFHHPRGKNKDANPYSDPQSWDIQRLGNVGIAGHTLYLGENNLAKWHGGEIDGYLGKFGIWGPVPSLKEESEEWKNVQFCADYLTKDHDKPFFLACGLFTPHAPHIAPQKYFDMHPLESITLPELPADDMNDIPAIAQSNFSTPFFKKIIEKGEYKNAVRGYLACISFADDLVGDMMAALNSSKYADNTIVVLFTDNGFQLGHKNRWEKYSLWRMGTNVPLIVREAGQQTGQRCERAVSLLDLYPTLLDMLGFEKPSVLQGTSFKPLLEDPKAERTTPAVITFEPGNVSVVWNNWNYIRYKNGAEELYNRSEDMNEYHNLASQSKYAELKVKLAAFIPHQPDLK